MRIDETGGIVTIGVQVTGKITITEATYKRIIEDAAYFLNEMTNPKLSSTEQNRYARIILPQIAFYIQSLSRALVEKTNTKNLRGLNKYKKWSENLKGFMIVYYKYYGKELQLNTDGLHDIFLIRNYIIAHPQGFTTETDGGEMITKLNRSSEKGDFKKFKDFPHNYTRFNSSHLVSIVEEVINFLKDYHNLIKKKTSDKLLLSLCWPTELIQWKTDNKL